MNFAINGCPLDIGHGILPSADAIWESVDDFCDRPMPPWHRLLTFAMGGGHLGIGQGVLLLADASLASVDDFYHGLMPPMHGSSTFLHGSMQKSGFDVKIAKKRAKMRKLANFCCLSYHQIKNQLMNWVPCDFKE